MIKGMFLTLFSVMRTLFLPFCNSNGYELRHGASHSKILTLMINITCNRPFP